MLTLTAKLLVLIALPTALTILWKLRSQTAWICIFAALAALTISSLARPPLFRYALSPIIPGYIVTFPPQITLNQIVYPLAYAIMRNSVLWTVMRFKVTKINAWKDAVLFGLAYSAAAAFINLTRLVDRQLLNAGLHFGTTHPTEPQTRLEGLTALMEIPLDRIIDYVATKLPWYLILHFSYEWSLPIVILNVATALAVLYTIQRKKIWPFGAAILCYVIFAIASSAVAAFKTRDALAYLLRSSDTISIIFEYLGDILTTNTHSGFQLMFENIGLVPITLAALPPLALALYVHRAYTRTPNPNPPQ